MGAMSTKNCTSQIKPGCCQRTQCEGGAMQNGTRKAYFNFSLAAFDTSKQQQQAKHGPYTLKGGVVK